ncbi:MAG TPA: glucuronate isomerase [Candidatus Glassbacteria bacterium]|nr:glucuronate isomerase [Candidatus Glassbacteria bacterium]
MNQLTDTVNLRQTVVRIVQETPVLDMHTHIYPPAFGELLLWGVDELLTYHYLVAEYFRYSGETPEEFLALDKARQAEKIWQALFIEHSPIAESNRGVLTVLNELKLEVAGRDLNKLRGYFSEVEVEDYVDTVFELANVEAVVMTNDPFDNLERPVWEAGRGTGDSRFRAALRIDPILMDWDNTAARLAGWGYRTSPELTDQTLAEIRRFLTDWISRMKPLYLAVSLPPSFRFPEESKRAAIVENCIVPAARQAGIPFAMMIGVKKLANPRLGLAGDSLGKCDMASVEAIARSFPDNRFLVTFLSRENQHEACVMARKFSNVLLFGCWWFMNNPSLIREITAERFELLGTSIVPQHSDARVLDQLIYKWKHSREIIAGVLAEKYEDLLRSGWAVTEAEIRRDVKNLLSDNFKRFVGWK